MVLSVSEYVDFSYVLGRYIAFDFHKECKNMRWDRLSILLDQVAEIQDELR